MPEEKEFNAQAMLQRLGISTAEEDVAVIPSVGMSFGAGSIIAQWTASIMYWFLINEDYVQYNQDDDNEVKVAVPAICKEKGDSGWYDMYYLDYETALNAYYTLDPSAKPNKPEGFRGYKPKVYWVFTAPTASVLNSRDLPKMIQGFGDQLVFSSRVMALRRGRGAFPLKERHEFGLLSLPGAVASVADFFDLPNAGFDLSEFVEPDAKDSMDDEFFAKFCGDIEGDYKDSVLYERRAALWASLGEDNPDASAIIGAKTASGKPNKQATTSEKLSACLSIAQGKWTAPLYARVVMVPNPLASDDGEHYDLPVLGEIFQSEAEARATAQAELAGDDGETPIVVEATCPPMAGWAGGKPEEVVAYLRDNKVIPLPEVVPPPERAKLIEASFLETWENVVAWDEYAKTGG